MKADAATVRVVDGVCQQVVDVDEKPAQQKAKGLQPFLQVEGASDGQRDKEVQSYMDQECRLKLKTVFIGTGLQGRLPTIRSL